MDGHDRLAARAELAQKLDDRALGDVDALERLVHEVELRVLDERPRQEHALLLPARELGDLASERVHLDAPERVEGRRAVDAARTPQPAEVPVAAHQHDVEHVGREVPVDGAALRHVPDAAAVRVVRAAEDERPPRGGLDEAEDRADERRLARAVRADDRGQRALRDLDVDVPEDGFSPYATVRSVTSIATGRPSVLTLLGARG